MFESSAEAIRAGLLAAGSGPWLSHPVLSRRAVPPTAFAAAGDFALGPPGPVAADPAGLTPYCLDPAGGRLWLCDVNAADLAGGAPFAYAVQRARATRLVAVPLADPKPRGGGEGAIPLLSIGRCGSTLAGHLLGAAGATVVTEIDAFTALGDLFRRWPADTAVRDRLARVADLAFSALPSGAVVKMRSQATMAAPAILAGRQGLLLVRSLPEWHASMARKFPDMSADDLARDLTDALRAAADAAGSLRVLSYDALLDDPVGVAGAVLGHDVSQQASAIVACLSRDSQRGTALARDGAARDRHEATLDFVSRWHHRAPTEALRGLGLTPMLEPAGAVGHRRQGGARN